MEKHSRNTLIIIIIITNIPVVLCVDFPLLWPTPPASVVWLLPSLSPPPQSAHIVHINFVYFPSLANAFSQ